jgi:carbon storage regulator CsrA
MLVLSRRLHEKILFPGLNTAVGVVGIQGGVVRLGIEAPPEVKVMREELTNRAEWGSFEMPPRATSNQNKLKKLNRLVRDQLNCASIGLAELNRQLQSGLTQDAQATLARIDEDFRALRKQLESDGAKSQPLPGTKPRRSKALLVEDNANERELLAVFLRMANMEVDTAGDGADALDYLRACGRPDVVLLDMGLPRCDGPTMVREIRRDPALAGLKIFAVTGHLPNEYGVAVGPGGVDRWFHKPVDPTALLHDLETELTSSSSPAKSVSKLNDCHGG